MYMYIHVHIKSHVHIHIHVHIKICFIRKYVNFLGNFSRHNLIKIYMKTHQSAPNFQNFFGELAYVAESSSIYVQL